jgi:hypothetical protein
LAKKKNVNEELAIKQRECKELAKSQNECKVVRKIDVANHPAVIYKIHLQVKQEYLFEFVTNLLKELEKPEFPNIRTLKYAKFPRHIGHKSRDEGGGAAPIIVLYVVENVDLLDNEKRNKIIDPMLATLIEFVNDFCKQHKPAITIQELAWPVVPRFNKKINDVVYIAGGNGQYKPKPSVEEYKEFLKTGKYKNTVVHEPDIGDVQFSDDLCFVKGHEYFTPAERVPHKLANLKESLSSLKAKLQALTGQLELLKKKLQSAIP